MNPTIVPRLHTLRRNLIGICVVSDGMERPAKRPRREVQRQQTEVMELSYPATRPGEAYHCQFTMGIRAWPPASSSGCKYHNLHGRIDNLLAGAVGGRIVGPNNCFLAFNVVLANGGVPSPILGNGDVAFVFVDVVMDIWETFVDKASRGRDFGGQLAMHAFELAREKGWRVRPSCTFITHWLTKRPDMCACLETASTVSGQAAEGRRRELCRLSLVELARICLSHGKPDAGSKAARIERIVRAEFGLATSITVNGREYQITVPPSNTARP